MEGGRLIPESTDPDDLTTRIHPIAVLLVMEERDQARKREEQLRTLLGKIRNRVALSDPYGHDHEPMILGSNILGQAIRNQIDDGLAEIEDME